MQKSELFSYLVVALAVAGLVGAYALGLFSPSATSAANSTEVRWLIAHEPTSLFDAAGKRFAEVLREESSGELTLVMLTPSDVGFEGDVPTEDVLRLLEAGEIDLATTFATGLANEHTSFEAVNEPFRFDGFEHALSELDGAFGSSVLERFTNETPYRGIAFTLSGGFRVLASHDGIFESIDDFEDANIITTAGVAGVETFRRLGANPLTTPGSLAETPALDTIDGVEITYTRVNELAGATEYINYITETNHSLFLTAIIGSDSFFESLSSGEQAAVESAAKAAAVVERADSIELGIEVRASLIESGVKIEEASSELLQEMRDRAEPLVF